MITRERIELEHDEDTNIGIIGGDLTFIDGSSLKFKEVLLESNIKYRFHYMDLNNKMICRWDNAPHHKELQTFPSHLHLPNFIKNCKHIDIIYVIDEIENIVINKFEKI